MEVVGWVGFTGGSGGDAGNSGEVPNGLLCLRMEDGGWFESGVCVEFLRLVGRGVALKTTGWSSEKSVKSVTEDSSMDQVSF